MRCLLRPVSTLFVLLVSVATLASCGGISSPSSLQKTVTPTPAPSKTLYMLTELGVGAFRADNGQQIWTFPLKDSLDGYAMTIAQGVVYVAHSTSVYALDAKTGKSIWTGIGSSDPEQMAALDAYVYVASACTIYSYNTKDGSLAWRKDIPTVNLSSNDTHYVGTKVFVENNLVYGWCGDSIAAFNPGNGNITWRISLPAHLSDNSDSRIEDVAVTPGVLVIKSQNTSNLQPATGEVIGVKPDDGTQLWKIAAQDGVHVANNIVYIYRYNDNQQGITLSAVGLQDGNQQWSVSDPAVDSQSPLTFSDTAFYAATGPSGGDLDVHSLQDGHVLWNNPGAGTYKSLFASGDQVFGSLDQQGTAAWDVDKKVRLWLAQGRDGTMQIIDQRLYFTPGLNNVLNSSPLTVLDPTKGTTLWALAPNTPNVSNGIVIRLVVV